MNKESLKENKVRRLTLAAMLTAIVVILQLLGSVIRFGVFSVSLVLVPIVIGAAMLGMAYGAWLGFAFSLAVLFSGDASQFLVINALGTVMTVLVKGTLAGLCAGFVYRLTEKIHPYLAVVLAAIVCPVVNTGIFLIGCRFFFWEKIGSWASAAGFASTGTYAIVGLVGLNFVFELAVNVILSPVIARLLGYSYVKSVGYYVYGGILTVVGFAILIPAMYALLKSTDGSLFAPYHIKEGLTAGHRQLMLALFADVCRIAGIVLLGFGFKSKNAEKQK